jgi:anti-sigma B factor antagonist
MRALVVEPRPAVIGDGQIRLRLTGELNCFTTELLADSVNGAVRDTPCELIELDVAGVRFIDSAGIRGLLHRRAEAERAGCRLVLVNPTEWVRRVLRATGLLETFGVPDAGGVPARRSSYKPRDPAILIAESAAIRRRARETRQQAAAQQPRWS